MFSVRDFWLMQETLNFPFETLCDFYHTVQVKIFPTVCILLPSSSDMTEAYTKTKRAYTAMRGNVHNVEKLTPFGHYSG